jgi:hypothetical protein
MEGQAMHAALNARLILSKEIKLGELLNRSLTLPEEFNPSHSALL